jgi:glycerol uptake facilitator-like aquaporin
MNTKSNKVLIGELLGTYTLFTIIMVTSLFAGSLTNIKEVNYLISGLIAFIALMIAIVAFGKVSGGHFNPGVTINQVFNGATNQNMQSTYYMGQIIGGILAFVTTLIVVFATNKVDTFFVAKNQVNIVEFFKTIVLEAIAFSIFLYAIAKANYKNIVLNALQISGTLGALVTFFNLIGYNPTLNLVAVINEIANAIKTFSFGGLVNITAAAIGQVLAAFVIGKAVNDKYDN